MINKYFWTIFYVSPFSKGELRDQYPITMSPMVFALFLANDFNLLCPNVIFARCGIFKLEYYYLIK
jgi:hypothetical protein